MAWLNDHPPARSQFRHPRRDHESGVIVVHTAENTPDFVAFDGGAEAVARFIQGRSDPGSYHELVDSDSSIQLVEDGDEAFHDGTGSNPHSWGLSIATRADVWPLAPEEWRNGAVYQAAARAAGYARRLHDRTGIVIPPRRLTREESTNKVPGFISHAERDPTRRSDPGKHFPWDDFLLIYARLTADLQGIPVEEEDMPAAVTIARDPRDGAIYQVVNFGPGTWLATDYDVWITAVYWDAHGVKGLAPEDWSEADIDRTLRKPGSVPAPTWVGLQTPA